MIVILIRIQSIDHSLFTQEMGCFSFCGSDATSSKSTDACDDVTEDETLIRIPRCTVTLMDDGDAAEIGDGEFSVTTLRDGDVSLATVVRVGDDLTWPLTKDEPVVRVDSVSYLFTIPVSDGDALSYGVRFGDESGLASLDELLRRRSCFSGVVNAGRGVDWKEFAPRVEDYNNVLARAIAGGTGHIIRGIFSCTNAYTNQVQKGGQMTLSSNAPAGNGKGIGANNSNSSQKKSGLNKNLKRVRKLSKTTEKLSKTMLNGVGIVTGSVVGPMVRSETGKSFLKMVPGEVLLASLDAVNKILDAAEAAEKQALSATSGAATRMVSNRFGEKAGEATGDVLATAGHVAGTAWNVFKIRKALNPASSLSTGVLKKAAKT